MAGGGGRAESAAGSRGATRVYGPQKGLRRGLRQRGTLSSPPGAGGEAAFRARPGAACRAPARRAGWALACVAFLGARLEPGFDLFARQAALSGIFAPADLVIIGEGAIDPSTFMGKGVGHVAARCRGHGVPCIALAGIVEAMPAKQRLLTQAHALTDLTTLKQAKANPAYWLEQLAARVAGSVGAT